MRRINAGVKSKNLKIKCWTSTKRSFQRQKRSVGMEAVAQKEEKQNMKVVRRLLGQNLPVVKRIQLAAAAKQAGGVGERRRRDEASAKNLHKENQVKRKNGL